MCPLLRNILSVGSFVILPLANRGQELPVSRLAFKKLSMQKLTRKETWRSLGGFWGVLAELAEGGGAPEDLRMAPASAEPGRRAPASKALLCLFLCPRRGLPGADSRLIPSCRCCFMHRPDSF